jgi:integrase
MTDTKPVKGLFERLSKAEIKKRKREHRYHDGSKPLTAKKVAWLRGLGRYRDGLTPGLLLQATAGTQPPENWRKWDGTKSWVFKFELNAKERMLGVGPYPTFSLAEARLRAKTFRQQLVDGVDPLAHKHATKAAAKVAAAKRVSFSEAATTYLRERKDDASWSNAKHAQQWQNTLDVYVLPILGNIPVSEIDTTLVFKVLEQQVPANNGSPAGTFWNTRRETASRVRGRIESILNWCTARKYRAGDNPASLAVVGQVFKKSGNKAAQVEHHPSLPYAEMPEFMTALRRRDDVASQALAFTILTVVRTKECLGAKWSEVDFSKAMWVIPAERMKIKKNGVHRIPLSQPAIELLRSLRREDDDGGDGYLFIGAKPGRHLPATAMAKVLKHMNRSDVTVHGMRSSFSTWCQEKTNYSEQLREHALAHVVGDASARAYARSDLAEKRRPMMSAWAKFCVSTPMKVTSDNVTPIGARR